MAEINLLKKALGKLTEAELVERLLKFPFDAIVMGHAVSVTGASGLQYDARGLDLICEFKGYEYPMPAIHGELVSPLPVGHRYLAAYLDWKSRL